MTTTGSNAVSLPVVTAEVGAARSRRCGAVVVVAVGCFDLLHPGHVRLLREARAAGDRQANSGCGRVVPPVLLVVALNTDESVRRLKGPGRPAMTLWERSYLVGALADVDWVTWFKGDDPSVVIRALKPDLYVKGGDRDILPEGPLVEALGGRVFLVSRDPGSWSTTRVIEHVHRCGQGRFIHPVPEARTDKEAS